MYKEIAMNRKTLPRGLKARAAALPLGWPPANLLGQREEFVKKVVFDLHGPILDWSKAFCQVAESLHGVKLDPAKVRYYNMGHDAGFPLSPQQFNQVFPMFARLARGGYGALELRPGIVETLNQIRAAGIGIEIWTWVPGAAEHNHETLKSFGTGIAQSVTRELLVEAGLVTDPLREIRFIKPDAKVSEMLEDHIPLIVEDNPVTAVAASMSAGQACILTPEPYNEHLAANGVLRLNNHLELAPVIISFFAELEKAECLLGSGR
jgi:hypothetical protein